MGFQALADRAGAWVTSWVDSDLEQFGFTSSLWSSSQNLLSTAFSMWSLLMGSPVRYRDNLTWWFRAPKCTKLKVQFSSVTQSCLTLCDPMNRSTPRLPVHHQLPEFTQTHVHRVSDAIQPSHPLSSPSPPAPNPSQHQSLFQWVDSSHEVAKVLEFQL